MSDDIACPPSNCPAAYETNVGLWDPEPLGLLKINKVPWRIIAKLAGEGWTNLTDLCNIFRSEDDILARASTEHQFGDGVKHNTVASCRRTEAALLEAYRTAKSIRTARSIGTHTNPNSDPSQIMGPGQRETMEAVFLRVTGRQADLEYQGNDHLLGSMFKECNKGNTGNYTAQEIVPKVPSPNSYLRPVTRRKRDPETGAYTEYEYKERGRLPQNMEEWRRMLEIFQISLLMAIWACPHQTKLQIKEEELTEFYRFIMGPNLATRQPTPPPLRLLINAERGAWRNISLLIHRGKTLSEALKHTMGDTLYWQHAISSDRSFGGDGGNNGWDNGGDTGGGGGGGDRRRRGTRGQGRQYYGGRSGNTQNRWRQNQRGNNNGQQYGNNYPPPANYGQPKGGQYSKGGKGGGGQGGGKGGKQGNGKGRSAKGKKGARGNHVWVTHDMKGIKYCTFHHGPGCRFDQNCRDSHKCPVDRGDGQGCNKNHRADQHR